MFLLVTEEEAFTAVSKAGTTSQFVLQPQFCSAAHVPLLFPGAPSPPQLPGVTGSLCGCTPPHHGSLRPTFYGSASEPASIPPAPLPGLPQSRASPAPGPWQFILLSSRDLHHCGERLSLLTGFFLQPHLLWCLLTCSHSQPSLDLLALPSCPPS